MSILSQFDQNIDAKACFAAVRNLLFPFNLKRGSATTNAELELTEFLGQPAVLVDSGRTALYLILEQLKKQNPNKTEVLVSGYTCVVVVNSILKAGLKPVYLDITSINFKLDPESLHSRVSANTLALIVQNTFGFVDDYDFLQSFCQQHDLSLIEDAAHSIGAKYKEQKIGTLGDFAFFSFGSNKIITSSRGGALTAKDQKALLEIRELVLRLPFQPISQILKHNFKTVCFYLFTKIYYELKLGKAILAVFSKLGLFPKIITDQEKSLTVEEIECYQYPNSLARLLLGQIKSLPENLAHREKIANIYAHNLNIDLISNLDFSAPNQAFLSFPISFDSSVDLKNLYAKLESFNLQLGLEWSFQNIVPQNIDFQMTKYELLSCSNAERIAKITVCLPTHSKITEAAAHKIIKLLNNEQLYR